MNTRFSAALNPHYPFDIKGYQDEITKQDGFLKEGALLNMKPYLPGGGSVIDSPWGSNQSIACDVATPNTVSDFLTSHGFEFATLLNADAAKPVVDPLEFCIKDLIVKPDNQLSLQRHQGREEYWVVKSGLLTVIVDGQRIDVEAGQAIFIPQGSVHCINNRTDEPVHVEELQFGICREEDNIRLVDATRDAQGNPAPRPTYPLTTENEFRSAQLFATLALEIARKRGLTQSPILQTLAAQPA